MLTSRKLKGAACAAVVAATAFIVSPPADAAVPVPPVTDNVFILPGASPDAWAPGFSAESIPGPPTTPASARSMPTTTAAARHATSA